MKKLFLLICILLQSIISIGQSDGIAQSEYLPWKCINEGSYTSFWYSIERTDEMYKGSYYFYIYFYSNSYLYSHHEDLKAITFVDSPLIIMKYNGGEFKECPMYTALIDWEKTPVCYFYTSDPNPAFKLVWLGISAYDYSRK